MPTHLKYEYIFSSFRLKVGSGVGSGSVEKKCRILIPAIHGIIFDCDTLSSLNAYICIRKISNRHKLCHCVFDRNMFDVFIRAMNRAKIMRFTSIFLNKTKKNIKNIKKSLHKFFWRKAFL